MAVQTCVEVRNEWDIVNARQTGRELSRKLGFNNVDQARITTSISELARNIYLYAKKGTIELSTVQNTHHKGMEVVAKDDGPGIDDLRHAMEDGFSTSGGLGAGLPGVKRLMDEFYIDSKTGEGTKVVVTKWLR